MRDRARIIPGMTVKEGRAAKVAVVILAMRK
jgi:hypothetical protein